MKKFAILFACLALVGTAYATEPTLSVYGPGGNPGGGVFDDVCWQQDYDVDGSRASSEEILEFGLVSFLANDFGILCDDAVEITKVIWWGGPYNWVPGDPEMDVYNVYIYEDNGYCIPAGLHASYLDVIPVKIDLGFTGGGLPLYQFELEVSVGIAGYTRYWVCAQADDHVFPPQYGHQQAVPPIIDCETMFLCEYFGYYDWTAASIVFGYEYETAFVIECTCGAPANDATTWGAVKALFQ